MKKGHEDIQVLNKNNKKWSEDDYNSMLLEQWITANEMISHIREQRNNRNNFYMSLMSLIIGGVLFSDRLFTTDKIAGTVILLVIMLIGCVICGIWIKQLRSYSSYNQIKYEVIREMEKELPANVTRYEYQEMLKRPIGKVSFTKQEEWLAWLFLIVIILIPTVMLISAWQ